MQLSFHLAAGAAPNLTKRRSRDPGKIPYIVIIGDFIQKYQDIFTARSIRSN